MKAIFSLRKHSYLKTIGTLLIAVALIAGVVGCEGEVEYDLAVDSTAGGVVTDPGEGTDTYDDGEVVDLVATPDCGYVFDNWTGDTTDIDDVNAAATNITMNADYSITANFKPIPPDHYKFYYVNESTAPNPEEMVELEDQFGTFEATVTEAIIFGNPVEKEHMGVVTPIKDDNRHYTVYWLDFDGEDSVRRSVEVSNQFNDAAEPQTLTVEGPMALAVPTQKEGHEMVECLNHYLLYWVEEEESPEVVVNLKDQFIPDGEDVEVEWPKLFANPVKKTVVENGDVAEIEDADLHWVLYDIYDMESPSIEKNGLQIANQFGDDQVVDLTYRDTLAVPSQKIVPPTPPLDHFKCYPADGPGLVEVYPRLEDQFGIHESVPVFAPIMFCNSVDKVHGTVETSSNPDNHLTIYAIEAGSQWWDVTVNNQFGNAQELLVTGPVALAVPTQKLEPYYHEKPKYLDHYLLYAVMEGLNVTATVGLDDQFPGTAAIVEVTKPVYFATPAIKGYLDYEPGFWDPEGHLVFYAISDNDEYVSSVLVENQFHQATLLLGDFNELLAVPSVKVSYGPVL